MRKRSAAPRNARKSTTGDPSSSAAAPAPYGCDDRERLAELVETATTSAQLHLDDSPLAAIKSLARASDANVHATFDFLMERLKKNHSQVRYLAVLLVDELFMRSKLFRALLVPVFDTFLLLSVGFRTEHPLPPPADRAELLRKKSVELVEKWTNMFGQHYRPIRLGHDYLKSTLRIEFPNAREMAAAATRQRREREERTQTLLKKKLQTLRTEYPTAAAEARLTLAEIGECLEILTPLGGPDRGVLDVDDEEGQEFEQYGVESLRRLRDTVEEEAAVPHESRDNSAVYDTLRDLYKLLTAQLANAQEWLTTLMRADPDEDGRRARDELLRDVIDLRNSMLATRDRCEGLGLQRTDATGDSEGGSDEDVVWDRGDVVPDGASVVSEAGSGPKAGGPAAPLSGLMVPSLEDRGKRAVTHEAASSTKQELRKQAPVLPWGAFLDNWGSKSGVPANSRGLEFENHWGKVDYDAMIPAEKIAELSVRASYYDPPKVETRPCSAPLRKGGLCPRRDLRVCPFHGLIVPRDEKGNPISDQKEEPQELPSRSRAEGLAREQPDGDAESNSHMQPRVPGPLEVAQEALKNVKREQSRALARRHQAKRVRDHNVACLRDAALASREFGFGETLDGDLDGSLRGPRENKRPKSVLAALLRKKPTSRDRLDRRLLSGRVRDATASQLTRDEEAAYREAFPNQWTLK